MGETDLLHKVHQLRRRWRLVQATGMGLRWAGWGGWVALALAALMKAFDRPLDELVSVAWAPLLFGLGGVVRQLMQPTALLQVALETDRRANLKERLSSAVEWLQGGRPATAVSQFLVLDAAEHAVKLESSRVFPLRMGRPILRAMGPLALVLAVLATPSWGLFRTPLPAEEVRAVRASAERLDQLSHGLPPQHPRSAQLTAQLKQLSHQLQQPGTDRQEAASRIRNLARQLDQERSKGGRSQGQSQSPGAAASKNARDNADRLAELARKLAKDPNDPQVRQQLAEASKKLAAESLAAKQADEAMQALQKGDPQTAAQKLAQASQSAANQSSSEEGGDVLGEVSESLTSEASELDPTASGRGEGEGVDQNGQAASNGVKPVKGKGKGEGDFGVGSTNEEEHNDGKHARNWLDRQSKEKSDWQEQYKKIYESQRQHLEQANTRVHGQLGRGRVLHAQGEMLGAPRAGGQAQIGATEVYLDSKQAAEQAVVSGNIPSEYREAVRSYFDGIDPRTVK